MGRDDRERAASDEATRVWDALSRGAEWDPTSLEPTLVETIHRLRTLGSQPCPDPSFADHLEDALMQAVHSPPVASLPSARALSTVPNGRTVRTSLPATRFRLDSPRSRWALTQFATAAIVLLAIAAAFSAIRLSHHELARLPVVTIASPSAISEPVPEEGMPVTVVWESKGGPGAPFDIPAGLDVAPDGTLWVADGRKDRFQLFAADGTFLQHWGIPGSGPGEFDLKVPFSANANGYGDVAFDAGGNMYVADIGNDRVQKFAPDRSFLFAWGEEGSGDGQFQNPAWIEVGRDGDVYVADDQRDDVQRFDAEGRFLNTIGEPGTGDGQFDQPGGVTFDEKGNVVIADWGNARMQVFTPDGQFLEAWGEYGWGEGQFVFPAEPVFDAAGRLWITDNGRNSIKVFDNDRRLLAEFGRTGANPATGFSRITSIAVDDKGQVYVSDRDQERVFAFRILPSALDGANPLEISR